MEDIEENNEYHDLPNNIRNQLKIIQNASKSIHLSDVLVSDIKEDVLQSKEMFQKYLKTQTKLQEFQRNEDIIKDKLIAIESVANRYKRLYEECENRHQEELEEIRQTCNSELDRATSQCRIIINEKDELIEIKRILEITNKNLQNELNNIQEKFNAMENLVKATRQSKLEYDDIMKSHIISETMEMRNMYDLEIEQAKINNELVLNSKRDLESRERSLSNKCITLENIVNSHIIEEKKYMYTVSSLENEVKVLKDKLEMSESFSRTLEIAHQELSLCKNKNNIYNMTNANTNTNNNTTTTNNNTNTSINANSDDINLLKYELEHLNSRCHDLQQENSELKAFQTLGIPYE